ncbi:MAG: hypothetical protein GY776_05810 [Alteromonas sp.]|nr:hypothetical protein [Alteromonas sp.]
MKDERYKQIMTDLGKPNSATLLTALKQVANEVAQQQQEKIDELQDTLTLISEWCEAYPLEVFPEPNFTKAGKVLEDNGIKLDAITASNMRRVLTAIQAMIEIDNQR